MVGHPTFALPFSSGIDHSAVNLYGRVLSTETRPTWRSEGRQVPTTNVPDTFRPSPVGPSREDIGRSPGPERPRVSGVLGDRTVGEPLSWVNCTFVRFVKG